MLARRAGRLAGALACAPLACGLLACGLLAACGPRPLDATATASLRQAPEAAHWRPLVLDRPDAVRPAAPPAIADARTAADMAELRRWVDARTPDDLKAIAYWEAVPPPLRWSQLARERIGGAPWGAPRAARALALVHAAIYDATIAAWDAKAAYGRAAPTKLDPTLLPLVGEVDAPSYPSEHAAIAYAAATVLAGLLPAQAGPVTLQAWGAAETRVAGGGCLRADLEAGKAIGEAVAAAVLARAAGDRSDTLAKLPLDTQPGQWTHDYPADPVAGTWRPWLLSDVATFRLPAPPAPGTPGFEASLADAVAAARAATPEQLAAARTWELPSPALQWNDEARALLGARHLATPRLARTLGYVHAGLADVLTCAWDTAYRVRLPRPAAVETTLSPALTPPPYPAYPSVPAACAGLATAYVAAAVPDAAAGLAARAAAAAEAGLVGGISYRQAEEDGLALGRRVAEALLARAQEDGGPEAFGARSEVLDAPRSASGASPDRL